MTDHVAGEARAVLREALARVSTRRRDDGTLELVGDLLPDLAEPLTRAHRRVAAELVAADAAAGRAVRDGGRRDADAFLALLLRVTDVPR